MILYSRFIAALSPNALDEISQPLLPLVGKSSRKMEWKSEKGQEQPRSECSAFQNGVMELSLASNGRRARMTAFVSSIIFILGAGAARPTRIHQSLLLEVISQAALTCPITR